jgi:thiamine-phosphate pyrophosphorylase
MIRCYVTDRRQGDLLSHVKAAVQDGVDFIQVREKDLEARSLFELVCRVRDAAAGTSTQILVNDRLDIALAAGVDGVQLPGNGLPAGRVRPFVRILGCSVHSVDDAVQAALAKPDFLIFGPIFETPGKTAVGVEVLRSVVASVSVPVLAIGGVTLANANEVLEAGAAGIAAIRMFQRD